MSVLTVVGMVGGALATVQPVYAQSSSDGSHYCQVKDGQFVQQDTPCIAQKVTDPTADPVVKDGCQQVSCNALITDWVDPAVQVLTVIMGLVVTISIVVAAIQFGSAGSDPGKVAEARKRLTNSIVAFLAYLFLAAFLQWFLPGGIL